MEWCKVLIAVSVVALLTACVNSQDYDICQVLDNMHMLSIGTRGTIRVESFKTDGEAAENQCIMRIQLLPQTNITIRSRNYRMPYCPEDARSEDKTCIPGCSYMFIYETFYPNTTYHEYRKNWGWSFLSLSNSVFISLCFDPTDIGGIVVDLEYQVNEKLAVIKGSYVDRDPTGVITSPNFPFFYSQQNEIYRNVFSEINGDGYIVVTFDDWHLSPVSSIWFPGSDHDIPGVQTRPVVISSGPYLTMEFSTGMAPPTADTTYLGFHATYEFISNKRDYDVPITDCGTYLMKSRGGTLTFSPPSSYRFDLYDCIWVVKIQPTFDKIYLKLEKLSVLSEGIGNSRLKISVRPGLTSTRERLYTILPGNSLEAEKGYVSDVGFYIRLQGKMTGTDSVIFNYASFDDVSTVGYCYNDLFQCRNWKCIDTSLLCDGHDHCGDNSDETDRSCDRSSSSQDYLSYSVIIPMVVAIFVIVVICLLVIFVRRCQHLARQPRDRNSSLQSISGNLTRGRRPRGSQIRMNVTIQQDMGDYPPSYDEVMQTSNANIGYLNMAFLWSQNDISANADPPPYSENISVILSPAALLDSSSSEGTSPSSPVGSHFCQTPSSSSDSSWDNARPPRVISNSSTSESDFSAGNTNMYATVSLQRSNPSSNTSTRSQNNNSSGNNSLQRQSESEAITQCPRNDASQEQRSQSLPSNKKRKTKTASREACVSAADIEVKSEKKKQRRPRRPPSQDCPESQGSASFQNTGGDDRSQRDQQVSSSGNHGPNDRRATERGDNHRACNSRNHSEERSYPRSNRPRDLDPSNELHDQSRSENGNELGRSDTVNDGSVASRPSSNYERVAVVRNGDILTLHLPTESDDLYV